MIDPNTNISEQRIVIVPFDEEMHADLWTEADRFTEIPVVDNDSGS